MFPPYVGLFSSDLNVQICHGYWRAYTGSCLRTRASICFFFLLSICLNLSRLTVYTVLPVYLELLGGRQQGLTLATQSKKVAATVAIDWVPPSRPRPLAPRITDTETEAHTAFVAELGEDAIWLKQ